MLTNKEYSDISGIILGKIINQIRSERPTFFPPAVLAVLESQVGDRQIAYAPLSDTDPSIQRDQILGQLGRSMAQKGEKIDACFYVTEGWIGDPATKRECVLVFGMSRTGKNSTAAIGIKRENNTMIVEAVLSQVNERNILSHFFSAYDSFHQSPP